MWSSISLLEFRRRHIQNGFDKAVGHLSSYNSSAPSKNSGSGQTEKEGATGGVGATSNLPRACSTLEI